MRIGHRRIHGVACVRCIRRRLREELGHRYQFDNIVGRSRQFWEVYYGPDFHHTSAYFEERIADWDPHLERMCAFWSSVALMSGVYHGQPMAKHLPLPVDDRAARAGFHNLSASTTQADLARAEHVPVIIHVIEMTQPQGHSTSGSHERYKSKERLQWEEELDCIRKMREWMIEQGIAAEPSAAMIVL